VEATPYQGVGRHISFADERVTFENLDAGCSSQHGGEQGRMIGVGCSREW